MSEQFTTASSYRKRTRPTLTLPSGAVFRVRRPGPEIAIKGGRLPASLRAKLREQQTGKSVEQSGAEFLESLTDAEFAAFMLYARAMVEAVADSPRLTLKPETDEDLHPDDLEAADFWALFGWGARGGATLPVETEGGEVSVEDLENFRADAGVQAAGARESPSGDEREPSVDDQELVARARS